ncbi:MAG: hypothetical protein WD052_05785 [Bacteroidales bacterium]
MLRTKFRLEAQGSGSFPKDPTSIRLITPDPRWLIILFPLNLFLTALERFLKNLAGLSFAIF